MRPGSRRDPGQVPAHFPAPEAGCAAIVEGREAPLSHVPPSLLASVGRMLYHPTGPGVR